MHTRATDTAAAARRLRLLGSCSGSPRPRPGPHLGLALLQQRLQALLRGPALVVVADQEDDVVPAVDTHHLEPHTGLVRVGRHRAKEAQVYALRRHGRAEGPRRAAFAQAALHTPGTLLPPSSTLTPLGDLPEPGAPLPLPSPTAGFSPHPTPSNRRNRSWGFAQQHPDRH